MKTDKQLLKVFQDCPAWLYELCQEPMPTGRCEVKSVALKGLQRTADVVVFPEQPESPLLVVEWQMGDASFVLQRLVMEMAQLEMDHGSRQVVGVVMTGTERVSQSLSSSQWAKIIHIRTLNSALAALPDNHLLRVALSPLVEDDDPTHSSLAKSAAQSYHRLRSEVEITPQQRQTLVEVYISLLIQRFPNLSQAQINTMIDLPSLRTTVAGREVYDEGRVEGVLSVVLRQLNKRFGQLPARLEGQIKNLNYLQLEALSEAVLDVADLSDLADWLQNH